MYLPPFRRWLVRKINQIAIVISGNPLSSASMKVPGVVPQQNWVGHYPLYLSNICVIYRSHNV
jgi:hypothetical protein